METLMNNNNKRKALGKGLEQLFSNESLYENPLEQLEEIVETTPKKDIVELNISELRSNPYQPRRVFDQEKLQELADSIKEYGVLEPIIVKKSVKGYEIVAGERRTKATALAGLTTIPAIIKDFSDEDMMQIAVLENIQREDLTAIEEAEAYAKLIGSLGFTQDELARKLGKSRSYVTNMLGLLKLPDSVRQDILNGSLSMGHARVLSKIESEELVNGLALKVKEEGLSVRALEELANNPDVKKKNPIIRIKADDKKYSFVEEAMTDKIGNRVRIKNNKIVIPFNSEKDLERILEIIDVEIRVD